MPARSRTLQTPASRRHASLAALALAVSCLSLACVVGAGADGPVGAQDWNSERGPVVPHDTFPSDCALCHAGGGWHAIRADFKFDHEREAGLALVGAHAQAECLRCHNDRGPVERFAARGCGGCHLDPHRGLLGSACVECHDERSWTPIGAFADHARTRFPLVGAHAAVACERCHPGAQAGSFSTGTLRCADCHADDLERARDPDHAYLGWVSQCDDCHAPVSWARSGYVHVFFALSGRHASLHCTQCHTSIIITKQADCAGCHLDEYRATTEPPHGLLRFSLHCQECHATSGWLGVPFSHPLFPIDRGVHSELACSDCHPNPGSFGVSKCVGCHAHERRAMGVEHEGVDGYVYDSAACYACHPGGR